MKYIYIFILALVSSSVSFGQTITDVLMPRYIQGSGTGNVADDRKVPFVCRVTISGLTPGTTYRYYNRFVTDPAASNTSTGLGSYILIKPTGFVRVTSASLSDANRYGTFTTDANGSYTGWFANEVTQSASTFAPGTTVYFRIILNNGSNSSTVASRPTSTTPITVINFGSGPADGTAIRSTAATQGSPRNFVMLYDHVSPAAGDRPVTGTFIESDGSDNSVVNGYADFYGTQVNSIDKTWGTIIPNNLSNGVRKIVQYSITDGSEAGFKTSADGSWPAAGGGVVGTAAATGGLTNVMVLDGAVLTLGMPVQSGQTITFDALPSKTYGDADFDAGATATSNLPVTYTSSNAQVATIVNGKIHIVGAGITDITATQTGNEDYSAATPKMQTLTVDQAILTISADNQNKVQGSENPPLTISYSGFVNGDGVSGLNPAPVISTTADLASPAGTYPITVSGAGSINYNIRYENGILTVTATKQSQTITFNDLSPVIYGAADFDAGATASSGLPVTYTSSNTSVATIVNGMIHITGAGTTDITASQTGNDAFEAAPDVVRSLTVDKKALTITAENKVRLYGRPNPAFTCTYNGFVYNDNHTHLLSQPVAGTVADENSPVGDYPITVSGASSDNYTIGYASGKLTIMPLPAQTITFIPIPDKVYGSADFDPGVTASSGLPVTYTSSNLSVATIVNGLIHIAGIGTTEITASQPGDATHAPAADIIQTLTVHKAVLTIRANSFTKNEGTANPPLTIHYIGFVNGDDAADLTAMPVVTTTATTNAVPGTYAIRVQGAASPNYSINYQAGTLTVLPAQGSAQNSLYAYISSPGQLQVNVFAAVAGKAVIQLFDQHGTRLLQLDVMISQGNNIFKMPVNNLLPGTYHVRVIGDKLTLKTKTIIQ